MTRAHNNIIDSKSVLRSILADPENEKIKEFQDENLTHLSVTMLQLRDGSYAVCDKGFEGVYMTYLFEPNEEERATAAYAACVSNFDTDA